MSTSNKLFTCAIFRRSRMLIGVLAGLAGFSSTTSAAAELNVDSFRQHIEFLAHDRLEGRGAGTRGLEAAASYIAARFEEAGLEPVGDDNTFFQYFEVTTGVEPVGTNELRIAGEPLAFEADWQPYGYSHTGSQTVPLVFAGYGIRAPEYEYDDYAALDVKNKVVLVLALEPGQNDSTSTFDGTLLTPHSSLRTKAIHAREQGAVGMLVVIGPLSDAEDRLPRLRADAGYYSTGILCGHARREALQKLLREIDLEKVQRQIDENTRPLEEALPEVELAWTVGLEKERTKLRNVLGELPGLDPHRAIVIGAHYDHLGMGGSGSLEPDSNQPHNGADDNASGTAALIELARHYGSHSKPEVTLIFAAFSGEELGLAGSDFYVKNPTYPLDFTSAMLNMDMVGRLRDDKLIVFGVKTAEEFEAILQSANEAGARFDLKLTGDGYGPSDQMSFFKKEVPVLHFFTGPHTEYHRPSDDAELVNYEGLMKVTQYVADVTDALREQTLTFVSASSAPRTSESSAGVSSFRSYLGTIPDYGQDEDLEGVLLTGVREGAPADKAGLQGGDLIVQINEMVIHNIYDFVHVLRTHRPEEEIAITVIRNDERLTLQAVLGHPK